MSNHILIEKKINKLNKKIVVSPDKSISIRSGLNGFDTQKEITINAGNSGTLARLILGLLVKSKKKVKLIGDKSLSKRDFSRVINPLRKFGANIESNKNLLPIEILGSEFLRPITYDENIGSAQVKSCMILAALNTPGVSVFNTRVSRNHTELMLKFLKYPIKIRKNITVYGQTNYKKKFDQKY